MGIFDFLKGSKPDTKKSCPNCGEKISIDIKDKNARCSKCGVHIYSMFKKKCPKCGAANELDAIECSNCKSLFATEKRLAKTIYRCPLCGYESESYMINCYSCDARLG